MVLPHCIGRGMSEQERDAFGHWLSGFTDGEGSFNLAISTRSGKGDTESETLNAAFSINLRRDDLLILEEIRKFLGCGKIHLAKAPSDSRGYISKPQAHFHIRNCTVLKRVIIPLFEKYQLRAKKSRDFSIWKQGVEMMDEIKNRKTVCIRGDKGRVVGTRARWSTDEINRYKELVVKLRSTRQYQEDAPFLDGLNGDNNLDQQQRDAFGNWLAGFVDGEGCFTLKSYDVPNHRNDGLRLHNTARFTIGLRDDDLCILSTIQKYLRCGSVHRNARSKRELAKCNSNPRAIFGISDGHALKRIVVPLFEKYKLRAKKRRDFIIWKQGVELLSIIKRRKFPGRSGHILSRWKLEERDLFRKLSQDLKAVRKYEDPRDPSFVKKTETRPLPNKSSMFDGFFGNDGKW